MNRAATMDRQLRAAARALFATGGVYGGWRRRPADSNWMLTVWERREPDRKKGARLVFEPAPRGYPWATLRILDHDLTCLAVCRVGTVQAALDLLYAYGIVLARHTSAYQAARSDLITLAHQHPPQRLPMGGA